MVYLPGEKVNSFFVVKEISSVKDKIYGEVVRIFVIEDPKIYQHLILFPPYNERELKTLLNTLVFVRGKGGENGRIIVEHIAPAFTVLKKVPLECPADISKIEIVAYLKKTLNTFSSCVLSDIMYTLVKVHEKELVESTAKCVLRSKEFESALHAAYAMIKAFENLLSQNIYINFEGLFTLVLMNILKPFRDNYERLSEAYTRLMPVSSAIFIASLYEESSY